MNQSSTEPRLTKEGITFTVIVDSVKHECLITPQALQRLCARKSDGTDADFMEVFHEFEANINGIARRLVAAGVAGSPLVMRPETFGSTTAR